MRTVVLDTNALMMPVECDVRLFDELDRLLEEYVCATPQAVRDELQKLADGAGEEATAASVGLDLAETHCESRETAAEYADDAVVELATRASDASAEGTTQWTNTGVVTNDGPLQERLLDAGVLVISLRGQNKLAITRP